MFMSVSDESFIRRGEDNTINQANFNGNFGDNSLRTCTREDMIGFLNRVLDRNKPLFVFNHKANNSNRIGDAGTPSFSMIALIENQ